MKHLMRQKHSSFLGILSGFGKYFDLDPVLLRALFILLVLITGLFPGVIAYFLVALVIPKET